MDELFELWEFFKLSIEVQDNIIKSLKENLNVTAYNAQKLNEQIEIGRINHYLDLAVKKAKPKPVKKPVKKKVVESDSDVLSL